MYFWQVITYRIAMVRVSSPDTDKEKFAQNYFKEPTASQPRLRTNSGTVLPALNGTDGDMTGENPVKAIELADGSNDGSSRNNSEGIAICADQRSEIRGLMGADGEPVREELSDHNGGNSRGSEMDPEVIHSNSLLDISGIILAC